MSHMTVPFGFSLAAILYLILVSRSACDLSLLSDTRGRLVRLDSSRLVFVSTIRSLSFLKSPDLYTAVPA